MPRPYRQFCGLARALDVIGERWTLLLVRELLLGPRRFTDLLEGNAGLTPAVLQTRLRKLIDEGLVMKVGRTYALTPEGLTLEPVVMAIGRWGERHLARGPGTDSVNAAWPMIAAKRRYLGGESFRLEVRVGRRVFQLVASDDALDVQEGAHGEPDVVLSGTLPSVARLLLRREVEALSELECTGSEASWQAVRRGFGLG